MKLAIIFLVIVAVAFGASIDSEEDEGFNKLRIAGGTEGKSGENLSYCTVTVQFIQKSIECGGTLVSSGFVLTSARCVKDCLEGQPSNTTVVCGQMTGNSAIRQIEKILIPNGKNGADAQNAVTLEEFKTSEDLDFQIIKAVNGLAMLGLKTAYTTKELDAKKLNVAKFTTITKIEELRTEQKIKICGKGVIDNKGKKATKHRCADMIYKTPTVCLDDLKGKAPDAFMPDMGTACLYYKGENNACTGDFYGPVYAYTVDDKKKITSQEFLGIIAGSPDIRPNAACTGGHTLVTILIVDKVKEWVNGCIANRVAP